jgi:hypothetical protein
VRQRSEDDAWLAKEHAEWKRDHDRDVAKHAKQSTLDADAQREPRSAQLGDLFKKGIDVGRSTATADLALARSDGSLSGHLHGNASGGGRMRLVADALTAELGGGQVETHGVDSGVVDVAPDASSVVLHGLSITDFRWARSKP